MAEKRPDARKVVSDATDAAVENFLKKDYSEVLASANSLLKQYESLGRLKEVIETLRDGKREMALAWTVVSEARAERDSLLTQSTRLKVEVEEATLLLERLGTDIEKRTITLDSIKTQALELRTALGL